MTVDSLVEHTTTARNAANDPAWKAASALPLLGANFRVASEVATSADDVARLGATPLVRAYSSLDWSALTPSENGIDLEGVKKAAPLIQAASHAVRESSRRLNDIETDGLLPQISDPLIQARSELTELSGDLETAASVTTLAPPMLGADENRQYLLIVQNNSETRATGGIPGALAVLSVEKGRISLDAQTSAGALATFDPPIEIDADQQAIFSRRVGMFMQDVNLTPDFPTTAELALTMWERRSGDRLDGVLSVDPVALSFILEATGPVAISNPVVKESRADLPAELTSKNVVKTLLSDTYASIGDPDAQDAYFAEAAKEVFTALASGKPDPSKLLGAIAKGIDERRVLLWSGKKQEQETIERYSIAGTTSGPALPPAQFGLYFNDGTGGKMDYWVKRSVQVVKDCTFDGYRHVTVRVTSTNTAPADAAKSLPRYVTGNGMFGVPAGAVQTNVVAYGPTQSAVDTVSKDGVKVAFAAQRHGQRPVGTSTIRLGPGESTTLDFNFGHIVQNAEPELVVTPTTQAVKDVLLAPKLSPCE
ncbi:DUF4012 domain-containing protein [Paenarthrobacter ureafaciens]